jgi:integrase
MATVRKRVRNGKVSYEVRYYTPAGRQKGETFARKVDADRRKTEIEHSKLKGSYINPALGKTKLAEVAERWWATCANMRPTTRDNYRRRLDTYVLPRFGAMPLNAIDKLAVKEWLATMPPPTATVALNVLKLVLDAAVDAGLLAANPASRMRRPKVVSRDKRFLTPAEIERLARAIDPRYATLLRFAAYSGLRFGELAGLKVGRLDLLAGRVQVVEAIATIGGKMHPGPTKTGERRTVRIPRWLCEELGAYLAGRPHEPGDYVFTSPRGGPLHHGTFRTAYFQPAVRAAGLDPFRFHDLRHTAVSLWISAGANVKVVQRQAGHKTAAMTLDTYAGLFPEDVDALMERLEHAHAAAADAMWSQSGPSVVRLPGSDG